jgi:hypothetical protein
VGTNSSPLFGGKVQKAHPVRLSMKFSATMTPKSFPMLMKALKNPTAILITHRKCNPEKISE